MLTKDLAICIRAIDYSETSQIVSFFTRTTGKIDAIAKGSKRPKSPFDGPIEVLSHGNIVFVDSGGEKLATLTEFQQQPALINLRNSLFMMYACLFAAELMNNLTHDYDPHPELFDGFLEFLHNANERHSTSDQQRDILALLILFQLTLLREIGLQPILSHCVNCKTSHSTGHLTAESLHRTPYGGAENREIYFSSSANGIICRDCEASFPDKIRLSQLAANCLGNLKLIAEAKKKTLKEIEKILIHHFTKFLGHWPKMAKYILTC